MSDEALKAQWIDEQLLIASKVIILPDPKPILATTNCDDKDRFVEIDITDPKLSLQVDNSTNDSIHNKCYYGGVDVSFPEENDNDKQLDQNDNEQQPMAVATYVIIEYPSMNIIFKDYEYFHLTIPYIPSFLAYREIEPIVSLIEKQSTTHPKFTPCIIFVDGNGIFHPRHAGLACFVGVRTNIPTIGIGKTLYCEDGITKEFVLQTISNSISSAVRFYTHRTVGTESNSNDETIDNNSSEILLFDRFLDHPTNSRHDNTDTDSQNDIDYHQCDKNVTTDVDNRTKFIHELFDTTNCIGLAIPLRGNQSDDILAYALVGHGGFIMSSSKSQKHGKDNKTNTNNKLRNGGITKNPIYISIGHDISLQEAVITCTMLCLTRIPEPVRQADLYGRALLREKK